MTASATAADEGHLSDERLLRYWRQKLNPAENEGIERHLASCASCEALSREVKRFCAIWERYTPTAR